MGDRFSQPLSTGHQNFSANFSILACKMVQTSHTFWPPEGGGGGVLGSGPAPGSPPWEGLLVSFRGYFMGG